MNTLDLFSGLYCHRLEIRFSPMDDISMNCWIGAVFRNGFLYASSKVCDFDDNVYLFDKIESIPLPEEHPYYMQLKGGFPKGFFFDCSNFEDDRKGFSLKKDRIYSVDLCLIGKSADYYKLFIQAIGQFLLEGFGKPRVPLCLIDVVEKSIDEDENLLFTEEGEVDSALKYPIKFSQLLTLNEDDSKSSVVELDFKTPVALVSPKTRGRNSGYQDKLNSFPSFYQFMRSALYRAYILTMLYVDNTVGTDREQSECAIEEYLQKASEAFLIYANIRYAKLYSTPKKARDNIYVFGGYVGKLTFADVSDMYIPIVRMISYLGIGNDINYGLGMVIGRERE